MKQRTYGSDVDVGGGAAGAGIAPGKVSSSSRLGGRGTTVNIFRVENADAARELATTFGARDDNGVAAGAAPAVDAASGSSGASLPADLRTRFESSIGTDLSGVRVHTGGESANAAAAVGARAYTVGQDIHFGGGQYAPGTSDGQFLIAHEVAHTVQQRGGAATTQYKLEVSTPGDSAEVEADRAAANMLAGRPADVSHSGGISRRIARDQDQELSYQELEYQGDKAEAAQAAASAKTGSAFMVGAVSVGVDKTRVGEMIADIDANNSVIKDAEKADKHLEEQYAPLATNTETKINLSMFNDRLDIVSVDTASFSAQYRTAHADYERILAEAQLVLSAAGHDSTHPMDDIGGALKDNLKFSLNDETNGLVQAFNTARNNLHTAADTMHGKLTICSAQASLLLGAFYEARAGAAAAKKAGAKANLDGIIGEIDSIASGVAKCVKIASAVCGLAGGAGAVAALGKPPEGGGNVQIESGPDKGLFTVPGETVDAPNDKTAYMATTNAMATDIASVFGGTPEQLVKSLVTAIGTYANKDKIANLQAEIATAGAAEKTFHAGAHATMMAAYHQAMEGAAEELQKKLQAFETWKAEMAKARDKLCAYLLTAAAKKDKPGWQKGQNQANAVVLLGDADRFLGQVTTAIAVGDNEKENLTFAVDQRKDLRGTAKGLGDDKDRFAQKYFRCTKVNDKYKLETVFVEFKNDEFYDENTFSQGGAGTIEGTNGVGDTVESRIARLKLWQTDVQHVQKSVQGALGLDDPKMVAGA